MSRVTVTEVKQIITTSVNVVPHIKAASIIVDKLLSSVITDGDQLKEIERWLAAHFVAGNESEQQIVKEKIGETEVTYQNIKGDDLNSTFYGQRAKMLDTSGTLANAGKRTARIDTLEAISHAVHP